jgi:hypothetical protein
MRAALFAAVLAVVMNAQAVAQPGPVKPDFGRMTYFAGLWRCTLVKHPDQRQQGTSFSFYGHTDPGGYWEIFELANGEMNITRDPLTKKWVFVYLGNGGDYGLLTSDGWKGQTLTITDVVSAGGARLGRATFTRLSDNQFRAVYFETTTTGTGQYQTLCTRR